MNKKDNNQLTKFQKVELFLNQRYEFRYNIISNDIEQLTKGDKKALYTACNIDELYRILESHRFSIKIPDIKSLLRSEYVQIHNPFQTYFEGLKEWNQKTNHIEQLCTFINAVEKERFTKHFTKMLVRVVKCALVDEYFNKQCFVLIGRQNDGKTSFCNWLCPPALKSYYTDNFTDDKDGLIALASNILINLDELAVKSKIELTRLKSVFSKSTVNVRRPYDAKNTIMARRCSFLGSTNEAEFLNDPTGSVRWLCFQIDGINWEYSKKVNIDAIWAQAYFLFKHGFQCDLTKEELEENEVMNRMYTATTPEMEYINKFYEPGNKDNHNVFMQTTELEKDIKNRNGENTKVSVNALGKALKHLGFIQETKRQSDKSYPVKGYYIINKIYD